MGNILRTITTGVTDYAVMSVTFPIYEGIIYSTCIYHSSGQSSPNDCFAEIGLLDSTDSLNNVAAVIVNGYFTPQARLGWSGRQPVVSEMFLYANVYAPANTSFRLSWLQLMPSADLNAKQTLDA